MSLIYWLEHGSWVTSSVAFDQPNVCRETDWSWLLTEKWRARENVSGHWNGWAIYTSRTSGLMNGHEHCDCTRQRDTKAPDVIENRYYFNKFGINVTYFHHTSWGIKGRSFQGGPPTKFTSDAFIELRARPSDWHYTPPELISHLLDGTLDTGLPLPTTFTLLYNQGVWNPTESDAVTMNTISQLRFGPRDLWWKTNSPIARVTVKTIAAHMDQVRNKVALAESYGWAVFDVAETTSSLPTILDEAIRKTNFSGKELHQLSPKLNGVDPSRYPSELVRYWDIHHFQPWVYNLINGAWLTQLADLGQSCQLSTDALDSAMQTEILSSFRNMVPMGFTNETSERLGSRMITSVTEFLLPEDYFP